MEAVAADQNLTRLLLRLVLCVVGVYMWWAACCGVCVLTGSQDELVFSSLPELNLQVDEAVTSTMCSLDRDGQVGM